MFRRNKSGGKSPKANHLSDETEPNVLSAEDGARISLSEDLAEEEFEDFEEKPADEDDEDLEDDELDEDELEEDEDPEEAARKAAELEAELQRQAEEFGLTSVEPTALYGPNGADVDALLQSLDTIDLDTAELLIDAWEAIPAAERTVVRRVIQRRYGSGRLGEQAYNAEHAVDEWLLTKVAEDEGDLDLWRGVAEAARDAVDALVLDDKLDDVDFNTLYGPWADVMDDDPEADGAIEGDEDEEGDEAEDEAEPDEEPASAKGGKPAEEDSEEGQFGPNTSFVSALFERLESIKPDQLTALAKAWQKTDKGDLKVAHSSIESLVKAERDWRDQVKAAQNQIAEWAGERTWRQPAIPPLADAVAALVLADVLEPEDAETLYGPWAQVVGEPAFPVFEDAPADED
jgi:hypothetical protein